MIGPALLVAIFVSPAGAESTAPIVRDVCAVAPDMLAVTIRHGTLTPARQVPYVAETGDRLTPQRHHNWLQRDGRVIGTLVGAGKDTLWIPASISDDQPLDEQWAGQPGSYTLVCSSDDDPRFAQPLAPQGVYRKTRPVELQRTGMHEFSTLRQHILYLRWPAALSVGSTYELSFIGHEPAIASVTYTHNPREARSEAVHVSQVGYRPDDPLKLAFLSLWTGDGGGISYPEGLRFELIDDAGSAHFAGTTEMAKTADSAEDARGANHTHASVYHLDFSGFSRPGRYRVSVEGIGCSYAFEIADDVWTAAHRTSVRGLLHQRNGIALGPPYTPFVRPRQMHPDDGTEVRISTGQYFREGGGGQAHRFADLVAGDTGKLTTQAWGGYMDAADWDRRIEHLDASRALLDLVSAFPEFYRRLNLNIPESDNDLPDVIDEALWGLDCFRRMQQDDGSVPGGIESAEHPRIGEASWQESHAIYQFAPDPVSTAMYAATAAHAARVLRAYDADRSALLLASAQRAIDYLDRRAGASTAPDHRINDFLNLAAVHLFALTREQTWHDRFVRTSVFRTPEGRLARHGRFDQGEAILAYVELPADATDSGIRANGLRAIRAHADYLIDCGEKTAFGWTGDDNLRISWGRLTSPRFCLPLVYAYRTTGEEKYLAAMLRAVQYATGANPMNLSFTSGVGTAWAQHIGHIDAERTNQPIPHGLTPMGPVEAQQLANWWLMPHIKCYPEFEKWPTVETYFDLSMHTIQSEPTVHRTITPTFYLWGHLAARPALDVRR